MSSSSSSSAICCPSEGWLTPHRSAAARKEPASTAAKKYRARSTRTRQGYRNNLSPLKGCAFFHEVDLAFTVCGHR